MPRSPSDESREPSANLVGGNTAQSGESDSDEHRRHIGGRRQTEIMKLSPSCEFQGGAATIVVKSAVDDDLVDDPEVARTRGSKPEPDRPAPLLHLGLLDHVHGRVVTRVVQTRDPRAVVNSGRVHGILVAEIPGDSARARCWEERSCARRGKPAQLGRREREDERLVADRIAHGVEHGNTIARCRDDSMVCSDEKMFGHASSEHVALGPGHDEPLGGVADLISQSPSEFNIAPQRYFRRSERLDPRVIDSEAWGNDGDLGAEVSEFGGNGRARSDEGRCANDIAQPPQFLRRILGNNQHRSAKFDESVRG